MIWVRWKESGLTLWQNWHCVPSFVRIG